MYRRKISFFPSPTLFSVPLSLPTNFSSPSFSQALLNPRKQKVCEAGRAPGTINNRPRWVIFPPSPRAPRVLPEFTQSLASKSDSYPPLRSHVYISQPRFEPAVSVSASVRGSHHGPWNRWRRRWWLTRSKQPPNNMLMRTGIAGSGQEVATAERRKLLGNRKWNFMQIKRPDLIFSLFLSRMEEFINR